MSILFRKMIRVVGGVVLVTAGAAKIVSLSGGDLMSLLFVFGIVVGTVALTVGDQ